jgi:hypothetical protein
MIKYEACSGSYPTITKIEVTRETEKYVFIKTTHWGKPAEDKRLKDNSWRPIFDTWGKAHNYIMMKAIDNVEFAQLQLKYAEDNYQKAINMKENEE